MTERICEHCGREFVSETLRDKLETAALILAVPLLPIYALHRLSDGEGLVGAISALMYVLLAIGAFYEVRKRDASNKAEDVAFGSKCPSCGGRSEDLDSPLGKQLIAYWSSPQTEDQQDIVEQSSTIPGKSEEDGTIAVRDGSPCE